MRALLVLVLWCGVARADVEPMFVSGQLRGTTATLSARYAIDVAGPTHEMAVAMLNLPVGATATSVVVHAPDGVHRLDLVDAERARERFTAINDTHGSRRWAVLVDGHSTALDVSVAAPESARLVLDVELHMPTCFYRDARYLELPVAWKRALAPSLRSHSARKLAAANTCIRELVDEDQLWLGLPSAEAATKQLAAHAGRVDLGESHIARLEIVLARQLGEVPRDLATVIVVDGSRSMTRVQAETQRELVTAYARAAGETQLQLVVYARTARALLPSWTVARTAAARLDRELHAIAPRNGSNVDAALAEAARWLDKTTGTKRVVLLTDERLSRRVRARFDGFASLLPAGTLIHVVAVDDFGKLERDANGIGHVLAEGTGGIAARVGLDEPIDPTLLLRPIRIDDLAITSPGWRTLGLTTCELQLGEGSSCVWWGEGDRVAGPIALAGSIWGTRIARVVTPDATRAVELARELLHSNALEPRALERVARVARAANAAWSFYGEWGRPGGYEVGGISIRGGSCCGGFRTLRPPQVRIGTVEQRQLPVVDLSDQFAHVITRCGLGDGHVEAELELTDSEIVEVRVLAPPAVARCVEDAVWDTAVIVPPQRFFRASSRIVLVH